jgi:hypothetical protein
VQNTLSKGYYVNPNGKTAFKAGSLQSPTHSYSSSEGNYGIMDNRIKMDGTSPGDINNRHSVPLNYDSDRNGGGGVGGGASSVMNNRRSAPEFLNEHNS